MLGAAILYTVGSITIPSLASVYNEMALKKNMDTSVHIQNFYLYFFGLLFNMVGLGLLVVLGHQSVSELFTGHSKVWNLLPQCSPNFTLSYNIAQLRSQAADGCQQECSAHARTKASTARLAMTAREWLIALLQCMADSCQAHFICGAQHACSSLICCEQHTTLLHVPYHSALCV